jgi:hypothetical protein
MVVGQGLGKDGTTIDDLESLSVPDDNGAVGDLKVQDETPGADER